MNTAVMGRFVFVGKDLGVVVGLPDRVTVPEDHYAVWFGERMPDGVTPLAKTVPIEYCQVLEGYAIYH